MTCDRCSADGRHAMGLTDLLHPQWRALCDQCKAELDQDTAAEQQALAEHIRRQQRPWSAPVEKSGGWEFRVAHRTQLDALEQKKGAA